MNRVILGPEYFGSPTIGRPISGAQIFVGDVDTDPEIVGNQKQLSVLQEDTTVVQVSQPVLTGAGGYPVHNGSPVTILVDGDYSLKVLNSSGSQIYYVPDSSGFSDDVAFSFDTVSDMVASTSLSIGDIVDTSGYTTIGDGGNNSYTIVASGTGTDDGGSFIDLTTHQAKGLFPGGRINVEQFGALGVGFDNTVFFQSSINFLGDSGGTVFVANDGKYDIENDMTINPNVTLSGQFELVGSPEDNSSAPYASMGSSLRVASTATITLKGGAGITHMLIYRLGMTFPEQNSDSFAGTAVTIDGDDAFITNSQILGFDKAIFSSGAQRPRIYNVWIDCENGIEITDCFDIARINNVHCWPFATIASGGGVDVTYGDRTTGIHLHDTADWTMVTDCFVFGYMTAYLLDTVNSCMLMGCACDNRSAPYLTGSRGIVILDGSTDTTLSGCKVAAQQAAGVYIDTLIVLNQNTIIRDLVCWAGDDKGIHVVSGDVSIVGGTIRNAVDGITMDNINTHLFIDQVRFKDISGYPILATVDTTQITLGDNIYIDADDGSLLVGTSGGKIYIQPQIASASPLLLPVIASSFRVTGTTDFSAISGGWASRRVTLIFEGSLTVTNSATLLLAGGTLTAGVGTVLDLVSIGEDSWVEVSRSNNS